MAFYETQFPTDISLDAVGGPRWQTVLTRTISGRRVAIQKWEDFKAEYDVSYGVRTLDQAHALVHFYNEMRGPVHGFRFKDWADYSVTDEEINNDGTATAQLIKTYGNGNNDYIRTISKPVSGSVSLKLNGGAFTDYTLDTTTGVITFTASPVPLISDVLTWTGEFDVPCAFMDDWLPLTLKTATLADITSIKLEELRI